MISSLSVSTAQNTQRFIELGREEKGEGEIEATWWRKRRVKREESNQASNHTPK